MSTDFRNKNTMVFLMVFITGFSPFSCFIIRGPTFSLFLMDYYGDTIVADLVYEIFNGLIHN